MPQSIYVAGLWLLLVAAAGCAAHRNYTADGQRETVGQSAQSDETGSGHQLLRPAGQDQASAAARAGIRAQARQAAGVLKGLIGSILQSKSNPQLATSLTRDVAQLSTDLDVIADSRSDQEFTGAILALCDPEPIQASARVGPILIGLGARMRANPPVNASADQVTGWAQYFDSLGETLVRIPHQCRLARQAVVQAKANVPARSDADDPAPRTAVRRPRQANLMLLCIAGAMLAPSPNRYPIGAAQRLGRGLEQCE
jgi:hypothetical protein